MELQLSPRRPLALVAVAYRLRANRRPRGLRDEAVVQLGLTLMAPNTHYPLHKHPAIETYLVLAGTASWRIVGQRFASRPPGSLILHEGNVAHAMETRDEPLLALYSWSGDILTAPSFVDE
jgi:anti-sigma factor ChrR (cupin superfamily)